MHSTVVRLSLIASVVVLPVHAQTVRLPKPDATLASEFSGIRGVRELPDGRLLISDYREQRVVIADVVNGRVVTVVKEGEGPGEARLPTRLIPARGDTTLLVDLGNSRLLVFDGNGKVARTTTALPGGAMGVHGIDAAGRFYYEIPGWMLLPKGRPLANDSVRVVRWDPRTNAIDTLATVQGERMRSDITKPSMTPRIPTVGYAAHDAWVMAGDALRIVRSGDYHIDIVPGAGAPSHGPSYRYATRPVTAADREEYVRDFDAKSPMSGKGTNGGMGFSPSLNETEMAALVRGTEFAERFPMFDADQVIGLPDGRLWVGHPPEPGEPVIYDLFDARGRRIATVELPTGRRVVAIGRRGLYVVAEDDTGIQHVERYSLSGVP